MCSYQRNKTTIRNIEGKSTIEWMWKEIGIRNKRKWKKKSGTNEEVVWKANFEYKRYLKRYEEIVEWEIENVLANSVWIYGR